MRTALRVCALLLIVGFAMAQTGDDPLKIRAAACEDRKCNKRSQVAFAPVTVSVQAYVKLHPLNRRLVYGLACDDMVVQQSQADLNGTNDGPVFLVEYREVGPGTCYARAVVYRSDGSHVTARSEVVILQPRF